MELILIRGLPGTGKSTFAKTLNRLHVEQDMMCMVDGEYQWSAEKTKPRVEACRKIVEVCLAVGADCVVSNTFTQMYEIEPYKAMAKKFGAKLTIFTLRKVYGNKHGVPAEACKKMKDRWEDCPGEIFVS